MIKNTNDTRRILVRKNVYVYCSSRVLYSRTALVFGILGAGVVHGPEVPGRSDGKAPDVGAYQARPNQNRVLVSTAPAPPGLQSRHEAEKLQCFASKNCPAL